MPLIRPRSFWFFRQMIFSPRPVGNHELWQGYRTGILLIVLNPLVLPLVHAKLGYLTMRFIWIAPVIPAPMTIAVVSVLLMVKPPLVIGFIRAPTWTWL